MVKTQLFTSDDIKKILDDKRKFIVSHKPDKHLKTQADICPLTWQLMETIYDASLTQDPDEKLENSKNELYYYDSYDEIMIDFPKAEFIPSPL